ncbi:MAG: hypothetical protein KIT87_21875 [Anaerolineae bacterium]|nr:hypothetical protein [Anaerolineae bacterium]
MPDTLPTFRHAALLQRLADLREEYQAATSQLGRTLGDVERLRLQRTLTDLERQMADLESQLQALDHPMSPTPLRPAPAHIDRTALRDILVNHFGGDDLVALYFDLGLAYDDLPGDSRPRKAIALIQWAERRRRYTELVEKAYHRQPNAPWYSETKS